MKRTTWEAVRFTAVTAIVVFALYVLGYMTGIKKGQEQIRNYYIAVEALLDMIYNDEDSFMDTIGESQEYWDYMIADEELNIGIE